MLAVGFVHLLICICAVVEWISLMQFASRERKTVEVLCPGGRDATQRHITLHFLLDYTGAMSSGAVTLTVINLLPVVLCISVFLYLSFMYLLQFLH